MLRCEFAPRLTALSAAIGFAVGTVEIAGLIGEHRHGALWHTLKSVGLDGTGFAIVGLFAVIWLVAVLLSKRSQGAESRAKSQSRSA
jgi:high-affinity nickel permease